MIKAAQDLLDYLSLEYEAQDWKMISAYCQTLENIAGPEEAAALGDFLLNNQGVHRYSELYNVVNKAGNEQLAKRFYQEAFAGGNLNKGYDLEILEVVGKFRLREAKTILLEYSLGEHDYYTSLHAVRGLLNYPCEEHQLEIREAIEGVYGKSLFNELVPALVCKLHDRKDVLEALYKLGTETCSTDSNGGIFLGFSLCGNDGLNYFRKAMLNPAWEAHYLPRLYVVEGMANLKLGFVELFREIKEFKAEEDRRYGCKVLLSLLEVKINLGKIAATNHESYADLQQGLFFSKEGNEADTFIGFAECFGGKEEAYRLEELLGHRLREEILLMNYEA